MEKSPLPTAISQTRATTYMIMVHWQVALPTFGTAHPLVLVFILIFMLINMKIMGFPKKKYTPRNVRLHEDRSLTTINPNHSGCLNPESLVWYQSSVYCFKISTLNGLHSMPTTFLVKSRMYSQFLGLILFPMFLKPTSTYLSTAFFNEDPLMNKCLDSFWILSRIF